MRIVWYKSALEDQCEWLMQLFKSSWLRTMICRQPGGGPKERNRTAIGRYTQPEGIVTKNHNDIIASATDHHKESL